MAQTCLLTASVAAGTAPNGSEDAVVAWWSFTKAILATAALKLVESGRLQLDDQSPIAAIRSASSFSIGPEFLIMASFVPITMRLRAATGHRP
jgi:hypothetical protein